MKENQQTPTESSLNGRNKIQRKVQRRQGLLIFILIFLATAFMLKGNYMSVGGTPRDIQEVMDYAYGTSNNANQELSVLFTLLVVSGVAGLIILFLRKWVGIVISFVGIASTILFLWAYSSDTNSIVDYINSSSSISGAVKGAGFYIPFILGIITIFLFGWFILTYFKEKKNKE